MNLGKASEQAVDELSLNGTGLLKGCSVEQIGIGCSACAFERKPSWAKRFRPTDEGHHGFRQSMSRKGNCWDNAPAESFFARLKLECGAVFEDGLEATKNIYDFIDNFYNTQRRNLRHNMSPALFEESMNLDHRCERGGRLGSQRRAGRGSVGFQSKPVVTIPRRNRYRFRYPYDRSGDTLDPDPRPTKLPR